MLLNELVFIANAWKFPGTNYSLFSCLLSNVMHNHGVLYNAELAMLQLFHGSGIKVSDSNFVVVKL